MPDAQASPSRVRHHALPRKVRRLRAPVVLAVGLLASCGKKEEAPGGASAPAPGKTVVRYLAGPDVGGFSKEIIKNFEAANPDIKVEMVEGPAATNTREDMYATSFMAKEATYDLVYMDVAWMPKFAAQGWLRPLDDLFLEMDRLDFLPGDMEGSRYEGKLYRVPIQSDGGVLYYRKDLLAAKGIEPPRAWDNFADAARKLQSPPHLWGFVFQGKQYEGLVCVFLELVWGNGGTLLDSAGKVQIDSPQAIEALTMLVNSIHADKFAPESVLTYQEEEARHAFQEGKAVFMRNWPYAWNLLQDEKSPVRGKVGMIPMVHGRGGAHAATLGGWGFGISAFSKNSQAAWKFLQYAAGRESQKLAYFKGGILPTRKSLFDDPQLLAHSPHLKDLYLVLQTAKPRPPHPMWARMSDALQMHVSAALSKQESPKQALEAAAKEIRAALGQ